jgi:uncharacterized membrane protein
VSDVPPPPPPSTPPPSYGGPPSGSPDVGPALSYGFNKYFANVGPVLAVIFIPVVAQLALLFIGQFVVKGFFGVAVFQLLSWIVGAIAALGIYNMTLQITAGQPPDIGKAFSTDRWGEWFLFALVYGIMVGVGLILCVIPGLFVLAFFGMAPYFFLDRGMSLGDALSASREAAGRGYALPVILSIIVGVAGAILCGIGALITAPAAYIAVAYLYRGATNQVPAP